MAYVRFVFISEITMVLGKARGLTQNGLRRLNVIGMRFVLVPVFIYDCGMENPNEALLDLMRDYRLGQHGVSKLCRAGRTAVYFWLCPPEHKNFQKISDAYLRLLELELGAVRRQRKFRRFII